MSKDILTNLITDITNLIESDRVVQASEYIDNLEGLDKNTSDVHKSNQIEFDYELHNNRMQEYVRESQTQPAFNDLDETLYDSDGPSGFPILGVPLSYDVIGSLDVTGFDDPDQGISYLKASSDDTLYISNYNYDEALGFAYDTTSQYKLSSGTWVNTTTMSGASGWSDIFPNEIIQTTTSDYDSAQIEMSDDWLILHDYQTAGTRSSPGNYGSIFTYSLSSSVPVHTQTINLSAESDVLFWPPKISDDWIVAGAFIDSANPGVHVYSYLYGSWQRPQVPIQPAGASGVFGVTMSIHKDTLAISNSDGASVGNNWITIWVRQGDDSGFSSSLQYLFPPGGSGSSPVGGFGSYIDLYENKLIVASPADEEVYIYETKGSGYWPRADTDWDLVATFPWTGQQSLSSGGNRRTLQPVRINNDIAVVGRGASISAAECGVDIYNRLLGIWVHTQTITNIAEPVNGETPSARWGEKIELTKNYIYISSRNGNANTWSIYKIRDYVWKLNQPTLIEAS